MLSVTSFFFVLLLHALSRFLISLHTLSLWRTSFHAPPSHPCLCRHSLFSYLLCFHPQIEKCCLFSLWEILILLWTTFCNSKSRLTSYSIWEPMGLESVVTTFAFLTWWNALEEVEKGNDLFLWQIRPLPLHGWGKDVKRHGVRSK